MPVERIKIVALAAKWMNEASRHEEASEEIGLSGDRADDYERDAHRLEAETLRGCADELMNALEGAGP